MFEIITPDEFKLAFDDYEYGSLADPDGNSPDNDQRVELCITDAFNTVFRHYIIASGVGKSAIKASARRFQLSIARYYLDTSKQRQSVIDDYNDVINQLEKLSSSDNPRQTSNEETKAIGENNNINSLSYNSKPRNYTQENLRGYRHGKTIR